MVLLVNHPEEVGLAEREPAPRDRRKNAVRAAPEGMRKLKRCAELAGRPNAELLSPLSVEEGRPLMELLARVSGAYPDAFPQLIPEGREA